MNIKEFFDTARVGSGIKRISKIIGIPVLSLVVIIGVSVVGAEVYYKDRIAHGVVVDDLALGGLTKTQASQLLMSRFNSWSAGVRVGVRDKDFLLHEFTLPQLVLTNDTNTSFTLYSYLFDDTIEKAFQYGHGNSRSSNLIDQIRGVFIKKDITIDLAFERERIKKFVFDELEKRGVIYSPVDARIELIRNSAGQRVDIVSGINGFSVNFDFFLDEMSFALTKNDYKKFIIERFIESPIITEKSLLLVKDNIEKIITSTPIAFLYENKRFEVKSEIYGAWLDVRMGGSVENDAVLLRFSQDRMQDFFEKVLEPAINKNPVNARFQINESGKVEAFSESIPGVQLDHAGTVELFNKAFPGGAREFVIAVLPVTPTLTMADANTLGVKEIIGIGRSSFAGSPANRRHNIALGASSVNGIVIAPNEEFSLLKVLGPIDGEHGYKEELVIKGNKTIPEFGGGLCQIGTTTFRGALNSGLPITERRNHSYQVSYYAPAGTDATIYDPAPDFKFLNDTGNHILIVTKIQGNDLIYEFWGTSDGRKSIVGEPRIFDVIKPPPPSIIESEELKPGEKKCTERAHDGAKAELKRTVLYGDGREVVNTWLSVYRPWQEVCLVGKSLPQVIF